MTLFIRDVPDRCEFCNAWIGPQDNAVVTPKADIICIECADLQPKQKEKPVPCPSQTKS